jgi:hypothetical protein
MRNESRKRGVLPLQAASTTWIQAMCMASREQLKGEQTVCQKSSRTNKGEKKETAEKNENRASVSLVL